ncbi:sortase [Rubrobacter radiotolerans]|uniref:Sortase n=1 Tax=Rubrobacter radiotolerans TaxID=42256 RepID=A0AB35T5H1_RUBRA|nr:sortase [Rubrobacter radiotolerans]MDX5895129.1 sortase [Rubrobacter radiotolerans]SMC07508.1 sortase A [Rubrobacter radiotolerans DSM 5868]
MNRAARREHGGSPLGSVFFGVLSLVMVLAGAGLIASFFMAGGLSSAASGAGGAGGFNVPTLEEENQSAGGPQDRTLVLDVPQMSRIDEAEVPSASGTDTEALDSNKAVHLRGTGFPWEEGANVYIAGHRLGYPGSESFLAFYDLTNLENGDEVYLTDSNGTRYTYRVFRELTVSPTDLSVTEPVEGKSVLTLQTCTLPDYSQRLVVQAELVNTEEDFA